MVQSITIDGKNVTFKATASTAIRYRSLFNRDLLEDFRAIEKKQTNHNELTLEDIDRLTFLAYIMARQAADENTEIKMPEDPLEWIDQFEVFPIADIYPVIVNLWRSSLGTISDPKKK